MIPPASTVCTALRISSMLADLEMKPEAPSSSARRMVSGSSCAETTTIGTAAWMPRSEIRPDRPLAPGIERSSSRRSMSSLAATSALVVSKSPASRMVGDIGHAGERLLQRPAKKRMIVRDHELVA